MKGLELARRFYEEYGLPMLEKEFPDELPRMAIGLAGHGSECFGFDDEISIDHDFEPGFCIWITEADDRDFGFRLMRAYTKLPKEYMGFKLKESSIYGTRGKGVHTIEDFYSFYLGSPSAPSGNRQWLSIPSFYLAEATNGEIFRDDSGVFSDIRETLLRGMPSDVRLKRLASDVFTMAQAGQYNYSRCLSHGEKGASVFALNDYCRSLVSALFLLSGRHMPYYKWAIRALRDIAEFASIADEIDAALAEPLKASDFIESSSLLVRSRLTGSYGLKDIGDYLEGYSYALNDLIADPELRNSPVML